jgi:AcrR family transcriptional regulator
MAVAVDEQRRPGRPRSAEADAAILEAAAELFAEHGFDGMSVDAVAQQAGVSKATIYRRYPGKIELCMAAGRHLCDRQVPIVDTGSVHDDLRNLARSHARLLRTTVVGRGAAQMIADAARNPELAAAYRGFTAERRATIVAAIQRGVERGELPADLDGELAAEMLTGAIFYRHLIGRGRLNARFADDVADAVLRSLRR